jgi:hypothetical protein
MYLDIFEHKKKVQHLVVLSEMITFASNEDLSGEVVGSQVRMS